MWPGPSLRRSLVGRVLSAYVAAFVAFAAVLVLAGFALRKAAQDSDVLVQRVIPISQKLTRLRASQEILATLVDSLPETREQGSIKPLKSLCEQRARQLTELRAEAIDASDQVSGAPLEIATSLTKFESLVEDDSQALDAIAEAHDAEDIARKTSALAQSEHEAASHLRALSERVDAFAIEQATQARARSSRFVSTIVIAGIAAILVAAVVLRRIGTALSPVTTLMRRSAVVAQGDLSPKPKVAGVDELSLLQNTFEDMVSAVSQERNRAVSNERFAAIGKMASHVTHEIRNPLSSIGLNLEMLGDEVTSVEAIKLLTAIRGEVTRLEKLAEEYLRVARLPSPAREADDLSRSIHDIVEFVRPELSGRGCKVSVEIAPKLPTVLFDEGQVRQALVNLLRNAADAMPTGGDIEVSVLPLGMSVEVSVRDRGVGISSEDHERIFDAFYTTKAEGTGLGLAITRQIAEAHGGSLRFVARIGGGADFRFALPIAPEIRA
jgi:two-component system, NtrC family, sensor kinase